MHRIADHSKALHGGSSWNVDSTVRSEFGWGSHTAHTAIVTYGDIHSHATVYASEDKILIILSSDPDFGASYTTARNEDKYGIELADIADVVIKREPSLVGKHHRAKKEVRRQSIFIFLKGGEACVIDTYDSDFSAKVIMMTWQANIARRSAGLGTLLSSEDHDMAAAYYRETIVCLQKATKFRELVDVLEDFSAEVLTDLELKDCAFKSRELIITCFQMLDNFLYKPAVLKGERGRQTEILPIHGNKNRLAAEAQRAAQAVSIGPDRASQQISRVSSKVSVSVAESLGSPFARGIELDPDSRESMSIEQEHKLKIVAVDRMKLIFCILKLFSSLMFSSDCLSSRFALLLGPSPLDLQSWLSYMIPDCYKLVCRALGCSETSTMAQIEAEIASSLAAEQHHRSKTNTHRAGAEESHHDIHSVSSTPRRATVADSILTPLSARMRTLAETTAPDEYAEAMQQLTPLKQSVRDVQSMLVFDVHRIFGLAKAMIKGNHLQTNLNAQLGVILGNPVASGLQELRQINSMGDLYVREKFWEESLEEIVSRISGILQDMASSPHITTGPTAALNASSALSSAHQSTNNLHSSFGSQMRLNFTMMASNQHNHSLNSLAGVGVNGFVSQMVPPSPRSPMSSARSNAGSGARPTRYRTSSAPSPMVMSAFSPQAPTPSTMQSADIRGAKPPHGAKKVPGALFFNSSFNFSTPGIAGEDHADSSDRQRSIVSPLRTQEIMLFYLATLLNTLCKDSYKIREVMISDLVSYWRSIIGILNVLCPRPEQEEDSVVHDHVSSSSKLNNTATFSMPSPLPASPSRAKHNVPSPRKRKANQEANQTSSQSGPAANAEAGSSSKFVKKFFGMFVSKEVSEPEMNDRRGLPKKQKKATKWEEEVEDRAMHIQQKIDDEKEVKIPVLYVFDYGKPKYGLSHASWTLLVLARMAIEDVIVRLNLDPNIIIARQKVKLDEQLLHDLGSRIGINEMIAEGDGESEDEYSVSRADSEASLDLGLGPGLGLDTLSSTSAPLSDSDKHPPKDSPFVVESRFRRLSKAGIAGIAGLHHTTSPTSPPETPAGRSRAGSLSLPQQATSPGRY